MYYKFYAGIENASQGQEETALKFSMIIIWKSRNMKNFDEC